MQKADLRESLISIQETEIQNLKDKIASLEKDKLALQPKKKPEPEEKVEPPVTKPKEPEFEAVKECSIFTYIDEFKGKNNVYKNPNQRDILTENIDESEYDGALTRVRPEINRILNDFHKKAFDIIESDNPIGFGYRECPKYRTYEFAVIDTRDEGETYTFQYKRGHARPSKGLEKVVDDIVKVLRDEGVWE